MKTRRLDLYLPQQAREQTKVVELAIEPGSSARPIALVEHIPSGEETTVCREAMVLEVYDVKQRRTLTRLLVAPVEPEADEPVEVHRIDHTNRGLDAELVVAVVRGLVADSDYHQQLRDHLRRFRQAAEQVDDAGPSIEELERAGRNEPCPCGSGRKFKKCCRRRLAGLDEMPRRHELSNDDFRRDWEDSAEPLTGVNQVLQGLWSVITAGDAREQRARRLLEDMGIDVDRQQVVEAVGEVETVRGFPSAWRRDFAPDWTWQRPLVETIAPVVAELLWQSWAPNSPRPHRIKTLIRTGDQFGGEPDQQWNHWAWAWELLVRWLDQTATGEQPELISRLDDNLDLDEGIEAWLQQLIEAARERVGEHRDDDTEEPAQILEEIAQMFDGSAPELANDAAVFAYAGLVDTGRYDRASEVLEHLQQAELADERAALYLCDLFVRWEFEAPGEHLELIDAIVDRALDRFDDPELSEAAEAFGQLVSR